MSNALPTSTINNRPSTIRLEVVHGLLFLGLMLAAAATPQTARWPLASLVPIVAYTAVVVWIRPLRRSVCWLRVGRLEARVVTATMAMNLISSSALVIWYLAARPDLGKFVRRIPPGNALQLALVGLLFAGVNAAVEEATWRGIVLDALEARIGTSGAIVIQALGFGAGHFAGIPGGTIGVAMASFYGVALGLLRQRAQGILPCYIAHLFADATIYSLVVFSACSTVVRT